MRDVLGDHGLAESARRDEDDVSGALEKVEREERFDERSVDGGGPIPVEVGRRLEPLEARARHASFESASGAVLLFEVGDVLEGLGGPPSLLGGGRH
jgi:hypothetical protein